MHCSMLLPVSPFTVWMVDVPPAANKNVDLSDVWGLKLKFFVRYRTQNARAAANGGKPRVRMHDSVWGSSYQYSS
jgi:hypothetical protein